jgi:hypothetical protein
VGSNYEPFESWGADVSMSAFQRTAFGAAGLKLLRYPGGVLAEWFDLSMSARCRDGEPANWGSPSYAALWQFARSAGVETLMLQTNPTPQWCGPGEQDASGVHAAAIAQDAARRGIRAVFEVGNEPDLHGGYFANNGGKHAYIARFIEQARAIHAAVPSTQVYGPALCGVGGNCAFPVTWDSGWLDAFLAATGDKALGPGRASVDGVSFHVYWHNEWGFSDLREAKIEKYGFATYWANTLVPHVRSIVRRHDSRDLPIVVSEVSLGNGIPHDAGQAQNVFTVLATLDLIGAFAASGVRSFQWFDANAAGPADFWMITRDSARPIFYAFAAWAKMGSTVLALSSEFDHDELGSYATSRADGSVQVLLINKSAEPRELELAFEGLDVSGRQLEITSLLPATPASDQGRSVLYNGQADPPPGALPPAERQTLGPGPLRRRLPAFSAVVLGLAR